MTYFKTKQAALQTTTSGPGFGQKKWEAQHVSARRKVNMSAKLRPWDTVRQVQPKYRGISLKCRPRVTEMINVCWFKLRSTNTKSDSRLMRDSFCNVSQSVLRFPVSHGEAPCFTTSSFLYSFEHDQIMSGASHLRGMGHPRSSMPLARFSDATCRQLSGESFSVPISAVIQTSLSLNPFGSWW